MSIPAEKYPRFTQTPIQHVMAVIVDRYGRKMADDIAREVMSGKPVPNVEWPRF